jgi:hypothetical protein
MGNVQPLTYDQDLEHRFNFHPADAEKAKKHETIRAECKQLAATVKTMVPPGREQALAITKIEEAMMWANAGLARGVPPGQFDTRARLAA